MKYLVFLLLVVAIKASSKFYVDSEGLIRDLDDRIVTFHGFNTVYKPYPYIPVTDHFDPKTSLSSEDFELLSSLGYALPPPHHFLGSTLSDCTSPSKGPCLPEASLMTTTFSLSEKS